MTNERRQFLRAALALGFALLPPAIPEACAQDQSRTRYDQAREPAEEAPKPEGLLPYYYQN